MNIKGKDQYLIGHLLHSVAYFLKNRKKDFHAIILTLSLLILGKGNRCYLLIQDCWFSSVRYLLFEEKKDIHSTILLKKKEIHSTILFKKKEKIFMPKFWLGDAGWSSEKLKLPSLSQWLFLVAWLRVRLLCMDCSERLGWDLLTGW